MAQAKAEIAGDNRPVLARWGYWRELEIAAAQSAAGLRVLDSGLSGNCGNYGVEVNVFTSTPTDWNGRVLRLNLVNADVARCLLRVPFRHTPPGSIERRAASYHQRCCIG